MREQLKEFDWKLYGLSGYDIDRTIAMFRAVAEQRDRQLQQDWERLRLEQPDVADDIMDDMAHYTYERLIHLWGCCLWRMQGVFEGILTQKVIGTDRRLPGLKAKLQEVKRLGHAVSADSEHALYEWAELRNAISHLPPETHRPVHLTLDDILEFRAILLSVLSDIGVEVPKTFDLNLTHPEI